MAKTFENKLDFINVDPNTLDTADLDRYLAYKDAYRTMKLVKQAFEHGMQDKAPQGYCFKFGYNFGKLAMALDVLVETVSRPKSSTLSLTAFLNNQVTHGDRA